MNVDGVVPWSTPVVRTDRFENDAVSIAQTYGSEKGFPDQDRKS